MDKRIAVWLASGAIILTVTLAGCQKKEEPAPPVPAPAAGAPAGGGAVASAPAGETSPATSPTSGEANTAEKQETPAKK